MRNGEHGDPRPSGFGSIFLPGGLQKVWHPSGQAFECLVAVGIQVSSLLIPPGTSGERLVDGTIGLWSLSLATHSRRLIKRKAVETVGNLAVSGMGVLPSTLASLQETKGTMPKKQAPAQPSFRFTRQETRFWASV